jgi:hypothetical protein
MKYVIVLFLLLKVAAEVQSQSLDRFRFEAPLSFAVHGGPTQYFGDLYSFWGYKEGIQPDYNIAFSAKYTLGTNFRVRTNVTYYQISGADGAADPKSGRIDRNLNFQARNWEGTMMIEYYLRPVKLFHVNRAYFNPYVFAGTGFTTNHPYADYRGYKVDLRPLRTENIAYPAAAVVFPLGLGLKYKTNVWVDIFIEGNYRFTLTDYLDDVSVYNISGFYEDLIADYGYAGEGPNPDRLRLAVRQEKYLLENGEPNLELIRSTQGVARRGSGDPSIKGSSGRYDGYFTLNMGIEIFVAENIWDDWIFRKKRGGYKLR